MPWWPSFRVDFLVVSLSHSHTGLSLVKRKTPTRREYKTVFKYQINILIVNDYDWRPRKALPRAKDNGDERCDSHDLDDFCTNEKRVDRASGCEVRKAHHPFAGKEHG